MLASLWNLIIQNLEIISKSLAYVTGISASLWAIYKYFCKPIYRHFSLLSQLAKKTDSIYKEISLNGGSSIKDSIKRLEESSLSIESKINLMQNVQDAFREDGPIGIFECTQDGKNLYVNRTYAKWMGLSKEDLMGHNWRNYLYSFTERDEYDDDWKEGFAQGREVCFPISFRSKTGEPIFCDVHAYPILGEKGELDRYLGILYRESDKEKLFPLKGGNSGPINPVHDSNK